MARVADHECSAVDLDDAEEAPFNHLALGQFQTSGVGPPGTRPRRSGSPSDAVGRSPLVVGEEIRPLGQQDDGFVGQIEALAVVERDVAIGRLVGVNQVLGGLIAAPDPPIEPDPQAAARCHELVPAHRNLAESASVRRPGAPGDSD